jgi:predicted carbohydrate-binding protein with CBM5 and CBM33 domain
MATVGTIAKQLKKRKQMLQELAGEDFGQMPIDVKSAQEQGVVKSEQAEKERKRKLKEREMKEAAEYKKQRAKELAEQENQDEEVEIIRVPRRK